jgi:hypothetical protein
MFVVLDRQQVLVGHAVLGGGDRAGPLFFI